MFWRKAHTVLSVLAGLLLAGGCSSAEAPAGSSPLSTEEACPTWAFRSAPQDGQLYAAQACVIITPDEQNHPTPLYLGGYEQNRIAEGVHDDLEACALLLEVGADTLVLVAMDLVGIVEPRAVKIIERLASEGADPDRVFVACTHTHNGPDTIGLWGRDYLSSGLDAVYQDFLVDAVAEAFREAAARMRPVAATFATGTVHVPGAGFPSLMRDSRDPVRIDDRLHAVRFDGVCGGTVATLVNFANHPETALPMDRVSADFPRTLRQRLSREYGGGALFFSGALGGLLTPLDVPVPARDEQGNPVLEDGEPVWLTEPSWDLTRSYGMVLAEQVIDILRDRPPSPVESIRVRRHRARVPITNIAMWFFFQTGLLEPIEITHEPGCEPFGCGAGEAHVIAFGDARITTSPGETFPETLLGRPETTVDYGPPWGEVTFPAKEPLGRTGSFPLEMHFALVNHFVGYIVPETDYLPLTHPDYYCELFSASSHSEAVLRDGLARLLEEPD